MKLVKTSELNFSDGNRIVIEKYSRHNSYLYDIYFGTRKQPVYLGRYSWGPNTYFKRNDGYVIIYEYIIDNKVDSMNKQRIVNILNLYDIENEMTYTGDYKTAIDRFNEYQDDNEELILHKKAINKVIKPSHSKRRYLTQDIISYGNYEEIEYVKKK